MAPSRRDALTIARICRVNHAGAFSAVRIYSAQILVARRLWPDCVPLLSAMLHHEIEHCRLFRDAMPARHSRPCRAMQFWSWGGWGLGFLTALLGRRGIWACTAAVEETVHRYLDDQLFFLDGLDPGLHRLLASIREEELAQLHHAEERLERLGVSVAVLRGIISMLTDTLIWLSTWGDSSRMARALLVAKRQRG